MNKGESHNDLALAAPLCLYGLVLLCSLLILHCRKQLRELIRT